MIRQVTKITGKVLLIAILTIALSCYGLIKGGRQDKVYGLIYELQDKINQKRFNLPDMMRDMAGKSYRVKINSKPALIGIYHSPLSAQTLIKQFSNDLKTRNFGLHCRKNIGGSEFIMAKKLKSPSLGIAVLPMRDTNLSGSHIFCLSFEEWRESNVEEDFIKDIPIYPLNSEALSFELGVGGVNYKVLMYKSLASSTTQKFFYQSRLKMNGWKLDDSGDLLSAQKKDGKCLIVFPDENNDKTNNYATIIKIS
ncbi:MAG: hypothetical protein Q7J67_03285 [bacterium]|nr:hypothetical protein [bacterium]